MKGERGRKVVRKEGGGGRKGVRERREGGRKGGKKEREAHTCRCVYVGIHAYMYMNIHV